MRDRIAEDLFGLPVDERKLSGPRVGLHTMQLPS